jgi:hypothetical protein
MSFLSWGDTTPEAVYLLSLVGVVTSLQPRNRSSMSGQASRQAVGPTQFPIQWIPGDILPGGKAADPWSLHLKQRFKINESCTPTPLWRPYSVHSYSVNSYFTRLLLRNRKLHRTASRTVLVQLTYSSVFL